MHSCFLPCSTAQSRVAYSLHWCMLKFHRSNSPYSVCILCIQNWDTDQTRLIYQTSNLNWWSRSRCMGGEGTQRLPSLIFCLARWSPTWNSGIVSDSWLTKNHAIEISAVMQGTQKVSAWTSAWPKNLAEWQTCDLMTQIRYAYHVSLYHDDLDSWICQDSWNSKWKILGNMYALRRYEF